MTVTCEHGEGLLERLRKRFTGKRPASRQEQPAVVPLHGPEDDDEIDDNALLRVGEGICGFWQKSLETPSLGPRYWWSQAAESWETGLFFLGNGGVVLVAERVETSAAGRVVLDPRWTPWKRSAHTVLTRRHRRLPWEHASVKSGRSLLELKSGI